MNFNFCILLWLLVYLVSHPKSHTQFNALRCIPLLSSKSFKFLTITFMLLIHSELILAHGVRQGSKIIFCMWLSGCPYNLWNTLLSLSIQFSWYICQKPTDHKYVGLIPRRLPSFQVPIPQYQYVCVFIYILLCASTTHTRGLRRLRGSGSKRYLFWCKTTLTSMHSVFITHSLHGIFNYF